MGDPSTVIVGSRTAAPNVAFANSAKAGERQPEQENLSINPQQLVVGWTTFVIIKMSKLNFFFKNWQNGIITGKYNIQVPV